jgi:hypothetical protein
MLVDQCEMVVGFLVPHRCPNRMVSHCIKCGRSFCDEHLEITPGGLVCLACQQGLDQPVAVAETARSFDAADVLVFQSVGTFDNDDDDMFSDLS